jgi:MFS family permease
MTWWFPSYYRGRMFAMFSSAAVVSLFIGPPIGGLLLLMDGIAGLAGWQWLFIMEALPAIVMAGVIFSLLTDRPAQATWLRPDQRAWLSERLASERAQQESVRKFSLAGAFSSRTLWLITIAYFGNQMWSYAVSFFLPLIVRGLGVGSAWIGLLSGLPYLFALVAMNVWGWHSDHTGERTWHVGSAWLLSSAGMAVCILVGSGSPAVVMVGLSFAAMGPWAMAPAFWALPSALLTGTAAAGGIAMIGAVGQLGSWFGPTLFGMIKDATGSDNTALLVLALAPVISTILLVAAGHDRRMERIPSRG